MYGEGEGERGDTREKGGRCCERESARGVGREGWLGCKGVNGGVAGGETGDWTVRGAASSNKIQSLVPKECESPGFFPPLLPLALLLSLSLSPPTGATRRSERAREVFSTPFRVSLLCLFPSLSRFIPLWRLFSFPSPLKGVRAARFDGSMILLRHYRASQTPNCSAYSPYYLT